MNVLQHFRNYYQRTKVKADSISQREFGIGIDKKINYRHKAFSNDIELQNFLVAETPRFISHSVGRFEFPWSQPMEKKTLLSADLVFDLDAFPEAGHNDIYCAKCIESAKRDTLRLVEQYLVPVFGFSARDMLIVFSGSKGFHIHIRSQAVQQLSSTARRLLVDFITGKEATIDSMVTLHRGSHLQGPNSSSVAWNRHFLDVAISRLDNPSTFPKKLRDRFTSKQDIEDKLMQGNWYFYDGAEKVLQSILEETVCRFGVKVDSPVTFDVHRLIRVPGTLHGDTGFIAKPLSLIELNNFEASKHAVAFNGRAAVEMNATAEVQFNEQLIQLKQGVNEVPLSLAVLLACRGMV